MDPKRKRAKEGGSTEDTKHHTAGQGNRRRIMTGRFVEAAKAREGPLPRVRTESDREKNDAVVLLASA